MTLLPLFERELRARARTQATFWTRFAAVLVGAIICLPELLSGGFGTRTGSSGEFIFHGIVVVGFLLSCGGCFLTADVLSRERREGTLGLLLLTRVRTSDVLLGKFGSAGLTSICALAALLPLMMIPVLAGGVTGGEAFRKGLAMLNSLFLALAAGLWASARAREQSQAAGIASGMLATLVLTPMILEAGFAIIGSSHSPLLGPIGTLIAAGDKFYKISPQRFWISLGTVHIAAWGLLLATSRRLEAAIHEDLETQPPRPRRTVNNWWSCRAVPGKKDPIEFLTQKQRGIRSTIWAAALVGLFLRFGVIVLMPFGVRAFLQWLPSNLISGALLAWAMTRFMIETRRSGALELLMTSPVGARTIVSGQWNALKQSLRWPLLLMLFPYLLQISTVGWSASPSWPLDQMIRQWAFIFFGLINTFFGIAALCWTGIWFGFKARSQVAAIIWTVAVAKGVPFFIYLTSQGLFAVGIIPTGISTPYDVRWYIPQFLTLLYYVRLMVWVRAKFLGELPDSVPLRFTLLILVSQDVPQAKISFQTIRD
jgi:ABC-type transport system involved in multi-copper enzyme maturation permease subunit